jgi:elongator complex protein 1
MNRGNLETVYPRALTLSSVNVSLSKHEYRTAILTLRANRVDLNLLYDHSPTEFCQVDIDIL